MYVKVYQTQNTQYGALKYVGKYSSLICDPSVTELEPDNGVDPETELFQIHYLLTVASYSVSRTK